MLFGVLQAAETALKIWTFLLAGFRRSHSQQ